MTVETDTQARLATLDVLNELEDERETQRGQWGNDHDDAHTEYELTGMATDRAFTAAQTAVRRESPEASRRLLIQAAAMLLAEVERLDREAAHRG